RRPRSRPSPDLRHLRGSSVLSSRAMGGALEHDPASRPHIVVRLSPGNLVVPAETSAAMILGEAGTADNPSRGPSLTLDDVFRRHVQRRPYADALIDPLNRTSFTGGSRLRLTYADADRIVSAIALRLRDMGLPTDAVVGIQLPNIAESFLATMAVLRAGMIVAVLPLLYRR